MKTLVIITNIKWNEHFSKYVFVNVTIRKPAWCSHILLLNVMYQGPYHHHKIVVHISSRFFMDLNWIICYFNHDPTQISPVLRNICFENMSKLMKTVQDVRKRWQKK